jgi:hypothetical protein
MGLDYFFLALRFAFFAGFFFAAFFFAAMCAPLRCAVSLSRRPARWRPLVRRNYLCQHRAHALTVRASYASFLAPFTCARSSRARSTRVAARREDLTLADRYDRSLRARPSRQPGDMMPLRRLGP